VALVIVAAWFTWTRFEDARLRIITTTSVLLMGEYLAGTLSEYHFMLTLVPLAMTIVIAGSPIRSVTGVIGIAWAMDALAPPPAVLGLGRNANDSAFRAIGMSILILTVLVLLARRGTKQMNAGSDADRGADGGVEVDADGLEHRAPLGELVGVTPVTAGGPSVSPMNRYLRS
jgi:hypothetical protein